MTLAPGVLEGIGYAAASCTTLAFVPQVLRVWRTRSAADISAAMYALFITGLLLWTVYGALLSEWPIVIANSITTVLAGSVLWMKYRFAARRAEAAAGRSAEVCHSERSEESGLPGDAELAGPIPRCARDDKLSLPAGGAH